MASENPFMLDLRDNSTKTIQIPDDKLGAIKELSELTLEQLQEAGVSIFPSPSSEDEAEGYKRGLTRNDCILRLSEGDKQGYQIQTNNLVGFVSYQGTSITIRSRFAKKDGNDFFLHYLMLKTLRLSTIDLPMPVSDSESILNLLLLLFPSYLTRAVSQGVFKQYQRFHYNDFRPKGTIDIARHIKCNVPFRGKIAYNTREQSYDNPVTQLVRHTIEVIRNKPGYGSLLTVNPEVAAAVRQIELATRSFVRKDLVSVVNANHRPCSHPLLTEYLPLQQLCLKILRNEDEGLRFTTTDDDVYGVLFDVAYLWEEYLATFLEPLGIEHPRNREREGVIYTAKDKLFANYPDFYRKASDEPSADLVLDAKYKPYESYQPSKEDIFQLLRYMYVLRAPQAMLLSPAHKDEQVRSHYELYGYGGTIDVKFLTIPQDAQAFDKFYQRMAQSEARFLAEIPQ